MLALYSFPTRRSSDLAVGIQEILGHVRRARQERVRRNHRVKPRRDRETLLCQANGRFEQLRPQQTTLCLMGQFKRSEEHTSELQSRGHLVCRLLLEKK